MIRRCQTCLKISLEDYDEVVRELVTATDQALREAGQGQKLKGGQYFALVMTDYPDPLDQSRELKQISGEYEFEFAHLIKPYANDQHIEVHPNDDMDDGFFMPDPKIYYRYYLAAAKQKLD